MNIYCSEDNNGNEEETKETMKRLLDDNKTLKSLSGGMIMEIMMPFKIPVNPMMDQNQCLNKIKDKIIDIIIDQKEQCVDYLTLPKFKNMSEHTKRCLKQILVEIWNQFSRITKENQENKKCQLFFCNSKNQKEIQTFHIGLFNFFKTSFFYGCLGNMNNQQYFPHNFPPGVMGGQNPQVFGPSFNSGLQPMGSHFLNNMIPQNQNRIPDSMHRSSFQKRSESQRQVKVEQQPNIPQKLRNQQYSRFCDSSSNKLSYPKSKKIEKEPPTPKPKHEEIDSSLPMDRNFMKCRCKGKISTQKKYFECVECEKKYHMSCLRIPNDAHKRTNTEIKCPQCLLRKNNIFYEIIGQPIQSMWNDEQECCKFKMIIRGKKAQQIINNQYSIQLRFLKFTGKSMFEWGNNTDAKQLVRKNIGFSEILLKNDMLNKGNNQEIKINIESDKGGAVKTENRNGPLIYTMAFVVRPKTVAEIMKEKQKFQETEENYLDRFFKQGENKMKIQILDGDLKLIETPVRGIGCQHISIFDLQQLLTHAIQFGTDSCFFCPKKCQNFKIDKKIQNQLTKIKNTIDNPDKYPSEIYYHRDGTFSWQEHMVQSQSNPDPSNKSSQIDLEVQEDFQNLMYQDQEK